MVPFRTKTLPELQPGAQFGPDEDQDVRTKFSKKLEVSDRTSRHIIGGPTSGLFVGVSPPPRAYYVE